MCLEIEILYRNNWITYHGNDSIEWRTIGSFINYFELVSENITSFSRNKTLWNLKNYTDNRDEISVLIEISFMINRKNTHL